MDIITHLTKEHREAEGLMASLSESEPGPARNALIRELETALAVHMAVEEQFLYPIVVERIGAEDADEANNEHDLARDSVATLWQMADEPGFGAAVDSLKGGIGHHVEEEEQDLFPKLREVAATHLAKMDPERLEAPVEATRAELYEKARAAGVEGRSTMTKDELANAVAGVDPS